MIKVIDNFLMPESYNHFLWDVNDKCQWGFQKADTQKTERNDKPFVIGNPVVTKNYMDYVNLFVEAAEKSFGKRLRIERQYFNAYPYGSIFSDWHKDDGDLTILYYLFDLKHGGETQIKYQNEIKNIEYKSNRLVIFPAHLEHRVNAHNSNEHLRQSFAIKTTYYENSTNN